MNKMICISKHKKTGKYKSLIWCKRCYSMLNTCTFLNFLSIPHSSTSCICILHQDNTSVRSIPPYSPLLYSKTGVYRGIH